nr:hypothetical protein [uncultured Roseococcus sp.]
MQEEKSNSEEIDGGPPKRGDRALDIWGSAWIVHESRSTAWGWPVLLGRPVNEQGGPRRGPAAIMSAELAAYLSSVRHDPSRASIALPLGRGAIKRLRAQLGYHWQDDRATWWGERLTDLTKLTLLEFAQRHGVSEAAASKWRAKLLVPDGQS